MSLVRFAARSERMAGLQSVEIPGGLNARRSDLMMNLIPHFALHLSGLPRAMRAVTLALAVLVSFSNARAESFSGSIVGRVTSASGEPLDDVEVSLLSPTFALRLVSDGGTFAAIDIPPGIYDLSLERAGHGSAVVAAIRVEPQRTVHVDVALPESEDDVVTYERGTSLADPRRTTTGLTITRGALERLPAEESAAAFPSRAGILQSNVRHLGARGLPLDARSVTVDGTQLAGGAESLATLFDFDSLETMAIASRRSGAGEPLGPAIDLTTRNPSSERSGVLRLLLSPESWNEQGRGFAEIGALAGGTILKDALWGTASAALRDSSGGEATDILLRVQSQPRTRLLADLTALRAHGVSDVDHLALRSAFYSSHSSIAGAVSFGEADGERLRTLRVDATFWRFGVATHQLRLGGGKNDADVVSDENDFLYLSDTLTWRRATLDAGVRFEQGARDSSAVPRIQLAVTPGDGQTILRAGTNRQKSGDGSTSDVRELFFSVEHALHPEFSLELALSRVRTERCGECAERADVVELIAARRLSNRWMLQGTASWSGFEAESPVWPEWAWSVAGGVELPLSIWLSMVAEGASEAGPIGDYQTVDARFAKLFDVAPIVVDAWVEVLNVAGERSSGERDRAVRVGTRLNF